MKIINHIKRSILEAISFMAAGFFWGVGIILAVKLADLLIK